MGEKSIKKSAVYNLSGDQLFWNMPREVAFGVGTYKKSFWQISCQWNTVYLPNEFSDDQQKERKRIVSKNRNAVTYVGYVCLIFLHMGEMKRLLHLFYVRDVRLYGPTVAKALFKRSPQLCILWQADRISNLAQSHCLFTKRHCLTELWRTWFARRLCFVLAISDAIKYSSLANDSEYTFNVSVVST